MLGASLVPRCLMLWVKAWVLTITGPDADSSALMTTHRKHQCGYKCFLSFFFSSPKQNCKTKQKKHWVLDLFLINTCLNQLTLLLGLNGKLESEPLHIKQMVSPSWWHGPRTTSSNKGTCPLRTMRKSSSQLPDVLPLPDACLSFIQILFCFIMLTQHSYVFTSIIIAVLRVKEIEYFVEVAEKWWDLSLCLLSSKVSTYFKYNSVDTILITLKNTTKLPYFK